MMYIPQVLDLALKSKTYLVGEGVTLADIITICALFNIMTKTCESSFLAPFPNLIRYGFISMNLLREEIYELFASYVLRS